MAQSTPITAEGHPGEIDSVRNTGVLDRATALAGPGGESDRDRAIRFGPFTLFTTQRLLLDGARVVRIGSRALDILIALIKRPGELVTNCELRELVWPNTFVVEANLTVNMAALRRALGDGQGGNRYIVNVPGRGYYFVAPVTLEDAVTNRARPHPTIALQQSLLANSKGSDDRTGDVGKALMLPPTFRILDIVESGDGTKTVVVVAMAEDPKPAYPYARAN